MKGHSFVLLLLLLMTRFSGGADLKFEQEPADQTVFTGESVKLSALATSVFPIVYQWYKGAFAVPGGNMREFTFTPLSDQEGGEYRVQARTTWETLFSRTATIKVLQRPIISINQPTNGVNIAEGQVVTIQAGINPDAVITNVAFFDQGSLLQTFPTPPYQLTQTFSFGAHLLTAIATDARGVADTSAPVAIRIVHPVPEITFQPLSQKARAGRAIELRAEAVGPGELIYQWYRDGDTLPGANSLTLGLTLTNQSQTGAYLLRVTNDRGSVESAPARVEIVENDPGLMQKFWRPDVTRPQERYMNGSGDGTLGLYQGIAYGNGMLVVTGDRGSIAVSNDGLNWHDVSPPFLDKLYKVRFLNGRFFAASTDSAIFDSSDGLNWRRTALAHGVYDMAFKDGVYVAVGGNTGVPFYSTNGISWKNANLSGATDLQYARSVIPGNGIFVAIDGRGANVSTNGTLWVRYLLPEAVDSELNYFKGQFLAMRTQSGNLYASPDGKTWNKIATSQFRTGFRCSVASPSRLMIFGASKEVYSSDDGVNFAKLSQPGLTYPQMGVYYPGGYFVVGCADVGYGFPYVTSSFDGVSWNLSNAGISRNTVTFQRDRFFTGPELHSGSGGGDWQALPTLDDVHPTDPSYISDVAYGHDKFVAVEDRGYAWEPRVFTSTNGSNFVVARGDGFVGATALSFAEDEFVAVNEDWNQIYRSADGINWLATDAGDSEFYDITKANGKVVAVGDILPSNFGSIVLSDNGGAIETPASGTSNALLGVTHAQGIFVVVGQNGTILYSVNARRWFPAKTTFTNAGNFFDVAYGGGLFLAPGVNGRVAYSWDGINWEIDTLHTGVALRRAAYGNGRWLVAGSGVLMQTGLHFGSRPPTVSAELRNAKCVVRISADFGQPLRLETSATVDAQSWTALDRVVSNGEPIEREFDPGSDGQQFFRAASE